MHPNSSPTVLHLKRRIYLLCLPLAIVSAVSVWILERAAGVLHVIDWLGIPVITISLLSCWILLQFNKISITLLERIIFGLFSIFMLASLSGSLFLVEGQVGDLAGAGYWFPVVYGMAFLMFGAGLGRLLSGIMYLCSMALGFGYVVYQGFNVAESDLLIFSQIYAANLLVLILLNSIATISRSQSDRALEMQIYAYTDMLTSLPNRRQLEEMVKQEMQRVLRYDRSFAIILFDLDRFKDINDHYGHDVGDIVLQEVGRTVNQHIRQVDSLGRWGGEEFMILVPELDVQATQQLAERLREVIEQTAFATLPVGTVTASFGMTRFLPTDTLNTLYKRADIALYAAKQQGRNCCVFVAA